MLTLMGRGIFKMKPRLYTIQHKETKETLKLTIDEILKKIINNDRSDEFTPYNRKDWREGLAFMTEFYLIKNKRTLK